MKKLDLSNIQGIIEALVLSSILKGRSVPLVTIESQGNTCVAQVEGSWEL